jgi:hypothetical protein
MNNTSVQSKSRRIELAEGLAVSVQGLPGDAIRCVRGNVWLTQEGDWRDYCLVAGVSFCADRRSRIVLSAIDAPGAVVFEPRAGGAHAIVRGRISIDSLETIVRAAQRARREWLSRALRSLCLRLRHLLPTLRPNGKQSLLADRSC